MKSIKMKIILTVIPVVIFAMFILVTLTYTESKRIIVNYAEQVVQSSTRSNEHEIEIWSQEILSGLNQIKNTINHMDMSDSQLLDYLKTTMDKNDSYKDGVYVGMENQKLLVPTGWIPDSDYVVKDRDWFKEGLKNSENFGFGSAYIDKNTGEYVLSASTMLESDNHVTRVAAADVSLKHISEMIGSKSILKTGKIFLVDTTQNKIVAINDTKLINTEYGTKNKNQLIRDIAQNMNLNTDSIENIKSDNTHYSVAVESINNTPWKIIGYVSHEEALGSLNGLERKINILFFVAVLVLIMLIERVIYYLLKPIKQLNNTIDQITHGDFTGNIHVRGQDEIATMGRRMQKFIETMRGTIKEVVQMSQNIDTQSENSSLIAKELYLSSETQSTAMVDLNQTVEELAKAVSEVAESTTELSMVAADADKMGYEVSVKMKDTVEVSEKGKRDIIEISTAMDQLENKVGELKRTVEEVDESSERINDIVKLIGEIAEQTNLLSLNAAIEAARAGEAGKGFAVVAEEIRKLAETSQESVNSIAQLTQRIKGVVNNTIDKTKESAASIKTNKELLNKAKNTFENIYMTVSETSEIVQNMIGSVKQVDGVASSVAAITQEQSAASEEILATSDNLANQANKVTENSYVVEKDASDLAITADLLSKQMKLFRVE